MDPPKNMLLILSELSNFYPPPKKKIDQKTFGFIMISGKIEIKILGGDA